MRNFILKAFLIATIFSGCSENSDNDPTAVDDTVDPHDFLSAEKYDRLNIEIKYVDGFAPDASTVDGMESFLQQLLNKPAGITVTQSSIPSPGNSTYSSNDIRDLEDEHRTQHTNGSTLTAYIFFADADYAGNVGDSKALGVAYGGSSITIFEKTVADHSGGFAQPSTSTVERIVIQHELGHLLGLVNNGSPMQNAHQDDAHGKHCTNEDCLMYWSTETTNIIGNISGGDIPVLDASCLEDLTANGGK